MDLEYFLLSRKGIDKVEDKADGWQKVLRLGLGDDPLVRGEA